MSITFILALLALVIALLHAVRASVPLWPAVVLLALAMLLPGIRGL